MLFLILFPFFGKGDENENEIEIFNASEFDVENATRVYPDFWGKNYYGCIMYSIFIGILGLSLSIISSICCVKPLVDTHHISSKNYDDDDFDELESSDE